MQCRLESRRKGVWLDCTFSSHHITIEFTTQASKRHGKEKTSVSLDAEEAKVLSSTVMRRTGSTERTNITSALEDEAANQLPEESLMLSHSC